MSSTQSCGLFITQCKGVLTFEFVYEILECDPDPEAMPYFTLTKNTNKKKISINVLYLPSASDYSKVLVGPSI